MELYVSLKPADESITKIFELLRDNKISAKGVIQSHCSILRYKGKECDLVGLSREDVESMYTYGVTKKETIYLNDNSLTINPPLDFEVLGKKRLALMIKRSSMRKSLDLHFEYLQDFLGQHISSDDCDCVTESIRTSGMMINPHLSISNYFPIGRPVKSLKGLEQPLEFDKLYFELKYKKIKESFRRAS